MQATNPPPKPCVDKVDTWLDHIQNGELGLENVKTMFHNKSNDNRKCSAKLTFEGAAGAWELPIEYHVPPVKGDEIKVRMRTAIAHIFTLE
ncbi:hypothetical protein [Candidatus Spongiihabitans sp.]|uniref:hypothetical protein n=1 Tax=Candidatus Spongiihabitans sp. TaxID=3101308 RepID=UPI003C6F21D9